MSRVDCAPQVEPLVEMYTAEAEEHLLAGSPDFVVDAIDNIDTKVCGVLFQMEFNCVGPRCLHRTTCPAAFENCLLPAGGVHTAEGPVWGCTGVDCVRLWSCSLCSLRSLTLRFPPLLPKVALLAACVQRKIPVLCCAGAGAKADPTRMRICDVAESTSDPLARAVRHRLRAQHGIDRGVQVHRSAGVVPLPELWTQLLQLSSAEAL